MRTPFRLVLVPTLLLAAACGTDGGGDAPDSSPDASGDAAADASVGDAATGAITWHRDVRPLAQRACAGCHVAGGAAPFAIDSDELVSTWGPAMVAAVDARRMPPWQADEDCLPVKHSRAITDDERALFAGWRDGGYALGEPSDYAAPDLDVVDLGEPTLRLDPGVAYAPDPARPDDYRCFLLPETFAEDTFLTATDVFPDRAEIVHHVLIYRISGDDLDAVNRRDENDEGPGFTCFGAVGVSSEQVLSAWAPGSQPVEMPPDSAMRIPAGSRLVMQVHYNLLGAEDPAAPPADRTTAGLWTLPAGQTPASIVHYFEFIDFSFRIPAGDPLYERTVVRGIPVDGEIVGALPHMHMLGESIAMRLVDTEGAEAACVVDLPAWDFNWQQVYLFDEADTVPVRAGDRLELSCVWDNSPGNQPVVNSERIEPRDVTWGDGTLDEMCYAPLLIRTPYWAGSGEGVCGGFAACVDACEAEDGGCLSSCLFGQSVECLECAFDSLEPCLVDHCLAETLPFVDCFERCDDDYGCIALGCRAESDALAACLMPALRDADRCGGALAECGVDMGG